MESASPGSPRPPRRRRRLALGILAILVALPLLLAGTAALLLASLDHPVLKGPLLAAMKDATGLAVAWDRLALGLDGTFALEGLRVPQPAPWDAAAPDLLSLRSLSGRLDTGALAEGRLAVLGIEAQGLRVTVVQDPSGRTSLDGLGSPPPAPEPAASPTPSARSTLLAWSGPPMAVDLHLADVAASWVRLRDGAAPTVDTVRGLDLQAHLRTGGERLEAGVTLASPPDGTVLEGDGDLPAPAGLLRGVPLRLKTTLDVAGPASAGLDLSADLLPGGPAGGLPPGPLVRLAAAVAMDRDAGTVRADLTRLDVLDGALAGSLAAALPDRPAGGVLATVEAVRLALRPDRIPAALRTSLPGIVLEGRGVELASGGVALREDGGFALRGPATLGLALDRAEAPFPGGSARVEGLEGSAEVRLDADGRLAVDGRLAARTVDARQESAALSVRGLALGVALSDLPWADALQGHASGVLRASLDADRLEAGPAGGTCALDRVGAVLEARGDVPGPDPWSWTGRGTLGLRLPGLRTDATLEKPGIPAAWTLPLDGALPRSGAAALPAAARRSLPGHATLDAAGILEPGTAGDAPAHRESLSLDLRALSADLPAGTLELPALRLRGEASGRGLSAEGSLSAEADRPRLARRTLAARVAARVDLRRPSGDLLVTLASTVAAPGSPAGADPALTTGGEIRWRPGRRSLSYRLEGSLRNPSAFGTALPDADATRLAALQLDALQWKAEGRVDGLPAGSGWPALPADPLATLRGEDRSTLTVTGLRYRQGDVRVDLPSARFSSTLEARADGVEARLVLDPVAADLRQGARAVALQGAALDLRARIPRADAFRRVVLDGALRVGSASQDLWPAYPVRDAVLSLEADLTPRSARLDRLVLEVAGGGTRLEVRGDVEGGDAPKAAPGITAPALPRPRSLRVEGRLDQDLQKVSGDPSSFRGQGRLRCPFRLESGDGNRLRLTASLEADGVDLALPRQDFEITGARGVVPVLQEVQVDAAGKASLVPGPGVGPWARVRFHDLHPYLKGGWFAADRLRAGRLEAGPLAGNLRVDRSVVALDQLQAAWHGGTVAGSLVVEPVQGDVRIAFRGDVTGVSAGDDGRRLDANASLGVSLGRQEVEGRVQLVSLGRQHLKDLLDLWDPAREVVAANRVRSVLAYGYPRTARIRMDGGFLSARVELGGIASVVRIDEIRGIPVGPLVRRFLPATAPVGGTP